MRFGVIKYREFVPLQELSGKDQEKVAEVSRVRVELQEQMGHLQAERTAQGGLKEKIAALEREMKGMHTLLSLSPSHLLSSSYLCPLLYVRPISPFLFCLSPVLPLCFTVDIIC